MTDAGARAETREREEREALRNASSVAAQRGLDLLRAVLFAVTVPRLLGPADFGRFALLSSLAQWFLLLSGLGTAQLMGRFVPVLVLRDDGAQARRLLGNVFALRLLTGGAAALLYLLLGVLWLRDLPLAMVAAVAATVALGSVARVPFAYFLGLNDAARWAGGEMARRWGSLVGVVVGTLAFGVFGACLGLAVAEAGVLLLGLRGSRSHLSADAVRLDRAFLAPFLRYNALFFGSNLLFALTERGGEALVRAVDLDYAQVGYFGLAASAWAVAAHGVWAVALAFLPLLTRLRAQDRLPDAARWATVLLKALTAAGVVACGAAALLGEPLVAALVGAPFRPAAALLTPIGLALVAYLAAAVGRVLALTLDRPRLALAAALASAAVLVGVGLPLAARLGARGVAWALVAASAAQAAVLLGVLRRDVPLGLGPWLGVLGLGGLFGSVALLSVDGLLARAALFAAATGAYAAALVLTGLVTSRELSALRRVLAREESELA